MTETNTELAIRLLESVEEKDIDRVMAFFTEDAVFIDPHYPNVRMQGYTEISEGLRWSFKSLKKFGFEIINTYPAADGKSVVISIRTAHERPHGQPLNFPQLFLFEFEDEYVKSLQAYVQYEPHGMLGLILKVTRLWGHLRVHKSSLQQK